jgi:hypothetical protein
MLVGSAQPWYEADCIKTAALSKNPAKCVFL